MEVWLTLLAGGLVTFATRLSFIQLFEKFEIPSGLKRALRFVPPAVLAAIIFPELLLREGVLALETSTFRLLAGLVAALVAWRTRSVVLTIAAGMGALYLLQGLF